MNFSWIWPQVSNKASARKAVRDGAVACGIIAVLDGGLGMYLLLSHQTMAGFDPWILVDGGLFAVISWRLWKNSRVWSVIGIALLGLETANKLYEQPNTFGIISIILLLLLLNATRGTFALHKLNQNDLPAEKEA